jgi:CheY-like chemotaxis protein
MTKLEKKKNECFLIDDDLDDQELFIMALQEVNRDMACVIANDGIEALQKLKTDASFVPDYIFLDVNMPKMNGLQCLAEIKKLSHLQDVDVIMFSTSSDKNIVEKSKELGATDFQVKPAGLGLLIQKLAKILAA